MDMPSTGQASGYSVSVASPHDLDGVPHSPLVLSQDAVVIVEVEMPTDLSLGQTTALGSASGDSCCSMIDMSSAEESLFSCPSPNFWRSTMKWAGYFLFAGGMLSDSLHGPTPLNQALTCAGSSGFLGAATVGAATSWTAEDCVEKAISLLDVVANMALTGSSVLAMIPGCPPHAVVALKLAGLVGLALAFTTRSGYKAVMTAQEQGRLSCNDIVKLVSGLGCGFSVGGLAAAISAVTAGAISPEQAQVASAALLGAFGVSMLTSDIANGSTCLPSPWGPARGDEAAADEAAADEAAADEAAAILMPEEDGASVSSGGGYGAMASSGGGYGAMALSPSSSVSVPVWDGSGQEKPSVHLEPFNARPHRSWCWPFV